MSRPHTPTQMTYLNLMFRAAVSRDGVVVPFPSEDIANRFRVQMYKNLKPYREEPPEMGRGVDGRKLMGIIGRYEVVCRRDAGGVWCVMVLPKRESKLASLSSFAGEIRELSTTQPPVEGQNFPRLANPSPIPSAYPTRFSAQSPIPTTSPAPPILSEEDSEIAFLRKMLRDKEQS
jgi:hypothetical protein